MNLILHNKTAHSLSFLGLLLVIPFFVPGLQKWQVAMPESVAKYLSISNAEASSAENDPAIKIVSTTPGEIEDASGKAMQHFRSSLSKTESGNHITRIAHYGDSPITGDGITSTVRRKLQMRFGDAGHGFVLFSKPWNWYHHFGIKHWASEAWESDPMFIAKGDHRYGFGGVSFTTNKSGAIAHFSTDEEGEVGKSVSAFDIYFLSQPNGGEFEVIVDGISRGRVSTASNEKRSGFHQVKVENGTHALEIKSVGNGELRMYGVVMESGERGIQYDSLGINGAFIGLLNHYMDETSWLEQLRHRNPDLVILGYGANESEYENWPMDVYEKDTKEVVRRIRAALPEASILFVGPMDRGKRGAGGKIITRPTIPKLIAAQRRMAAELGCAFFDTFTAMGGEGTVAKWRESKPVLMGGDLTHPTYDGSEIVGTLIHDALIRAYERNIPKA